MKQKIRNLGYNGGRKQDPTSVPGNSLRKFVDTVCPSCTLQYDIREMQEVRGKLVCEDCVKLSKEV